jgi:glycosyltransferase involved in cell wall biosynthesis
VRIVEVPIRYSAPSPHLSSAPANLSRNADRLICCKYACSLPYRGRVAAFGTLGNRGVNKPAAMPLSTDTRALPHTEEIELSIVMPCLNEAETLQSCIRKARNFLVEHGVRGEIVIGDNGSTDGSRLLAEQEGARVVNVSTRGYGAALFRATSAARGRYIIMGDSDDSYDFRALEPFLAKLREGYDLVMGNRFLGGILPGAMPWKNRHIGNPILTGIGRLFFRCEARDFHCGLRGYSSDAFRKMDLQTTGMEFASEMVIKASLAGMRIAEVPTKLHPDGRSRAPHLRPWRDGWRHLRFMLLYSPRWLFLAPVGLNNLFVFQQNQGNVNLRTEFQFHAHDPQGTFDTRRPQGAFIYQIEPRRAGVRQTGELARAVIARLKQWLACGDRVAGLLDDAEDKSWILLRTEERCVGVPDQAICPAGNKRRGGSEKHGRLRLVAVELEAKR